MSASTKKVFRCTIFLSILFATCATGVTELKNSTHLPSLDVTKQVSMKPPQIAAEGGVITENKSTHMGRERVTDEKPITTDVKPKSTTIKVGDAAKVALNNTKSVVSTTEGVITKPVKESVQEEIENPPKENKKPIVPKKGVNFPVNVSTEAPKISVSSTATKKIVHKPLITVADDEDPPNLETNEKTNKITAPKISQMDSNVDKKNKADYIVPIVAVILSVPLVAILISVLYKRGADWWQHRNYRRMDFLIEGMYNN